MKTLQLLYWYGRDFFVFAAFMTAATYTILTTAGMGALTALIWFKWISSGVGIVVHEYRNRHESAFYHNMGLGKITLMGLSLVVDFLVWLLGIVLVTQLSLS